LAPNSTTILRCLLPKRKLCLGTPPARDTLNALLAVENSTQHMLTPIASRKEHSFSSPVATVGGGLGNMPADHPLPFPKQRYISENVSRSTIQEKLSSYGAQDERIYAITHTKRGRKEFEFGSSHASGSDMHVECASMRIRSTCSLSLSKDPS
jgi:hypothetical protein